MIFEPVNKEIVKGVHFLVRNKADTLDYYKKEMKEGGFRIYHCVIQKVVIMDKDEWQEFTENLLEDRYDLFSRDNGGVKEYTDGILYRQVVMFVLRGFDGDLNTIYVDNSGYSYARYVGF
jgi:hypothetical protein